MAAEVLTYQHGALVVGDGPTGLSAALFLAKNDMDVQVVGENETYLHDAYLYNYLGIDEIDGSQFVAVARDQCEQFGADLHVGMAEFVEQRDEGGFKVETTHGEHFGAKYLILTEGDSRELSKSLGLEFEDMNGTEVVKTDKYGRTSMENVYAGGWTARNNKIQAAISVGDGAAIALDILSKEHDRQFHDFDVPE